MTDRLTDDQVLRMRATAEDCSWAAAPEYVLALADAALESRAEIRTLKADLAAEREARERAETALDLLFDAVGENGCCEERADFWAAVAECNAASPKGKEYARRAIADLEGE